MEIDCRLGIGNILYIVDEEGCELYERVDRIDGDLLITNDSSWYLNTLGTSWHIKEVIRYAEQSAESRNAFEEWSKSQGWETEGYPDARQRWLVWQAAWKARPIERESVEQLKSLLVSRDSFIVAQGLWPEFVLQLEEQGRRGSDNG